MALPRGLPQVSDTGKLLGALDYNVVDATKKLVATTATGTPATGLFHSTVVNRKSIPDITKDLGVRMGIERVHVQSTYQLQDEFGPNEEPVYGVLNDEIGRMRFVGGGWNTGVVDGNGNRPYTTTLGDYVEVVFYGTALNIMFLQGNTGTIPQATVSIDGGAASANILPTVVGNILATRNYSTNQVIQCASGLTLGLHTAKITLSNTPTWSFGVFGFEILNEQFLVTTANTTPTINLTNVANTTGLKVGMDVSGALIPANTKITFISGSTVTMSAAAISTATGTTVKFGTNYVKVNPGTSYINGVAENTASQSTFAYNSDFESITRDGASVVSLGSKGGRVVVYQKQDGSIAKAVTAVNASQANLSSASHTYEEVVRTHYPREFGAGRSDDFSSATGTAANRAFTLDDGTTTLVGNAVINDRFGIGYEVLSALATTDFITLTFIGTGLDVTVVASSIAATLSVTVDGTSLGSPITFASANIKYVKKIVSGLPYGTHTVKFVWSTNAVGITSFILYQQKKPTLPSGAIELADYNVMADFVATTTGVDVVGSGVLRKASTREFVYVGAGFSAVLDVSSSSVGWAIRSATNTDSYRYTFFGTGFDFTAYGSSGTTTATLNIDGSSYTGSASVTGTATWTPGTSTMTFSSGAGAGRLRVSGLALGVHTVIFTITGAQNLNLPYIDIITPIHSPKSNLLGDLQNTLPVGSCAMSDNRVTTTSVKTNSIKPKAWAQAVGVTSNPTTISNNPVPLPDMSATIKTGDSLLDISYSASLQSSTQANMYLVVHLDGLQIGNYRTVVCPQANFQLVLADRVIVPVSSGMHNVELHWHTSAGTLTAVDKYRTLIVREL